MQLTGEPIVLELQACSAHALNHRVARQMLMAQMAANIGDSLSGDGLITCGAMRDFQVGKYCACIFCTMQPSQLIL
ncbi:hypothetical protein D3C85_1411810 [compost metagenome]